MTKTADSIQYASVKTKRVTRQAAPEVNGGDRSDARITRDLPNELQVDPEMAADIDEWRKIGEIYGNPNLSIEQRMQLAGDVIDNRPEGFPLSESQIQEYLDGNASTGLVGGMETHITRQGLLDGTHVYYHDGNAMRVMTPAEVTQTSNAVAGDTKGEQMNVVATWQNVNGKTVRVFEQVHPTESDFFAYQWGPGAGDDSKGTFVLSSKIDGMSRGELNTALRNGLIQKVPVAPGWRSVVMPDGKTWFQDPDTNLWYQDIMPIVNQTDKTGGVLVSMHGDSAGIDFKYSSFASSGGVFMPFAGMSAQQAQRLVEADVADGILNPDNFGSRDETGEAQDGAPSVAGMYWDPKDFARQDEANMIQTGKQLAGQRRLEGFALRQRGKMLNEQRQWERETFQAAKSQRLAGQMPTDSATELLNRFGEQVGLRMFGSQEPKQPARGQDFDPKLAIDARRQRDIQRLQAPQPIRARLPQEPKRPDMSPPDRQRAPLPRVVTRQAAPEVASPSSTPEQQTSSSTSRRRRRTANTVRRDTKAAQYTRRGIL
jgi:hypothetical protein